MKKKVLSLVLALCMCLTLLPAQTFAAAAEGEGTHTHAAQPAGADPVYTVEGDTDPIDSAVLAVKAMIDALPDPAEVTAADYDAVAAAYDAFCALNEDQMAAVDNAEKLLALTDALTGGTQRLEPSADDVVSFTTAGENPTTTYYTSIADAFTAINGAATSGTITLLKNVEYSGSLEFAQSNVTLTLDLNEKELWLKSNGTLMLTKGGSQYTVKNGTIKSYGFAIETKNQVNVTLENVTALGNNSGTAGTVKAGLNSTFVIKSGSYKQLQVNAEATLTINGGTFTSIAESYSGSNSTTSLTAEQYGEILGDGCAYTNPTTNVLISYKDMNASTSVKVAAHATHTWTGGVCACGVVCAHPSIDGSNKCTQCNEPILAKVTMTGSSTTFYYLTVADAVSKAAEFSATESNGTVTVTLLNAAQWGTDAVTAPAGTYTIDLVKQANSLSIGSNSESNNHTLTIPQGAHVTIKCSGETGYQQGLINCSGVTVNAGGSLTLERVSTHNAPVTVSGSLTLGTYGDCKGTVTVNNGGNVTLNDQNATITTLNAETDSTVTLNDQNATITTLNAETGSTVTLYGKVTTLNAEGGSVTITGGEVSSAVAISNGTVNLNGGTVEGSITVTGGALNCGQDSSKNPTVEGDVTISGGTVTISKGTFRNNTMTISGGTVTIEGGNFKNVTISGNGNLTVKKAEGENSFAPRFDGDVTISGGEVEISAGTFSGTLQTNETDKTLANYLATGSRVSKSTQPKSRQSLSKSMKDITVESCTGHAETGTDLLCDYCGAALVATVTTQTGTVKYYATFSDAVKGSAEGDTITLLNNVTLTGNAVGIGPNRTLDLNGKTLTGSVTLNANSEGSAAPTVTGNGTISGTLTIGSANRQSVPAKIMNGTFTKLVNYSKCAQLHGGTFNEITYSVDNGGGIGSLLPNGKGFKKEDGGTATWYDKDSTYSSSLTNVSVADLPIQGVEHNFTWVEEAGRWRLYVDYGAQLKAEIADINVATGYNQSDVTYKWYDQQKNLVTSVTGSTYDMGTANATAPTGFTCEISLDGYTKKYTVYVNLRSVDLVPGTHFNAPTANTLTYNGQEQVLIGAGENLLTGEILSFQYRLNDTNATPISSAADVKATNAATYTVYYTVSADTNYYNIYTGSDKHITVTIAPLDLQTGMTARTLLAQPAATLTYNGTQQTQNIILKLGAVNGENWTYLETLSADTDYDLTGNAATNAGSYTMTIAARPGSTNYTGRIQSFAWSIAKAGAPANLTDGSLTVYNNRSATYSFDFATILPGLPDGRDYGDVTYSDWAWTPETGCEGYINGAVSNSGSTASIPINAVADAEDKQIGTLTVKVSSTNYEDFTLTLNVSATNRLIPTGAPTLSKTALTYGDALSGITLSGAMAYGGNSVPGTFVWTAPATIPAASAGYSAQWKFTPTDTTYAEVTGTSTITVNQKNLAGAVVVLTGGSLTYNGSEQTQTIASVTLSGTTLTAGTDYTVSGSTKTNAGSYTLTVTGKGNYSGTVTEDWTIAPKPVTAAVSVVGSSFTYTGSAIEPAVTVKDGDTVIPTGEYTVSYSNNTAAGTATVTVTDQTGGNYTVSGSATFTIGKAASSVATAPAANTLTYTGAEQELVTAGIAANGTMEYSLDGVTYSESIPTATEAGSYTVYYRVVGNTNYTDVAPATVSVTIANRTVSPGIIPNIPTVKTVTGEDGTALRITTTTLPDGTVEESWEVRIPEGKEAVTVPGTITVGGAGNTSHAIDIILPEGAGETDVEFRVSDVTSGTVVLLVHEDGTEEVLHDTVQTESGVRITVRGNMRVKIGNRSVTFSDTAGHWSEDDVNYVAARGLFVGIGNGKFGVGLEATRGTVLTVLARLAGVDTSGGATWYEKGVQWAVENGISDGTNPNDSITREQLAAMLYRFILLQGGRYEVNLAQRYSDAQQASDWACEALCWCTEHGILQGRKDGSLDPQGTATREEIAAMLARFLRLG